MEHQWMMKRFDESRGFVSKRIIKQVAMTYMIIMGTCLIAEYEKFSCILRHKDIYLDQARNSILWNPKW